MKDIDELLLPRLHLAESQKVPLYLMGHSNGGGIALFYSIFGIYRDRLAGVVVQSPLIEPHSSAKPFFLVIYAGKLAAKLFPNQQMVNKLDPRTMSRDKEVCRKFDEDELCHDTGTLQQLSDMLGRGKTLMTIECFSQWKKDLPLLVTHGSGDQVCASSLDVLACEALLNCAVFYSVPIMIPQRDGQRMSMLRTKRSFLTPGGIISVSFRFLPPK